MTSLKKLLGDRRPSLLLENTRDPGMNNPAMLFCHPVSEIRACNRQELQAAFAEIDRLRKRGYYLAGIIHYEAAYHLIGKLAAFATDKSPAPLLQFYAFQQPQHLESAAVENALQSDPESEPYIHDITFSEDRQSYLQNLKKIQHYIFEGYTYQVNHTLRMQFRLEGEIASLYRLLRSRQRVEFSALLQLPEHTILSLSPELFIKKCGKLLTSKPMKGTASRGLTPEEDKRILQAMQKDKKQLSENLMIVDLMRNDIGRLAKPGTMKVDKLFEIQTYETLHQMISTISGEVDADIQFAEIIDGLFPCGSITGAPKIRTMELIKQLESTPRGVYTGAIGYITPDNDFTFNVPIRTIDFAADSDIGTLGIGGGIIHESNADEEWQECLLKAQFLTGLNRDFSLIETCRYNCSLNSLERIDLHLQRLRKSANAFGFPFPEKSIEKQICSFLKTLARDSDAKSQDAAIPRRHADMQCRKN